MAALRSSMKMAICRASCALRDVNTLVMAIPRAIVGSIVAFKKKIAPTASNRITLSVPNWNCRTVRNWRCLIASADLFFQLLGFFFLGPLRLDSCNRTLQPMLNIFPQFFFGLRGGDGLALIIQRNMMTGNIFRTILLGHEVVQQALVAGVGTRGVPVIGTSQRILKD